jgi:hypothetical protein
VVEQRFYTAKVGGSNPSTCTNMTKPYNIVRDKVSKTVYSESYLTALIEESVLLKKSGVKKFIIDVFNKDVKVASYILS